MSIQTKGKYRKPRFLINKRGQAGELVQDTVALIIIALLLIIFFIISATLWKFPKEQLEIVATENSLHNQEHISLQAWLQKNIEIEIDDNPQKITIAELIRLSKINPKYSETLNQEAEKAFGILYKYQLELAKKQTGSEFYIPSNQTITINLEIQK